MNIPTSIPSSLSHVTSPEAAGLDATAAACIALTGIPAGSGPLAGQPDGAAGDPVPDFASLMMPPKAPSGDSVHLPAAMPPSVSPSVADSSIRLQLVAAAPDGASPPTREQLEAAAAMLVPVALMETPPPSIMTGPAPSPSNGPVANVADAATTDPLQTAASASLTPGLTLSAQSAVAPGPDENPATIPAEIPTPATLPVPATTVPAVLPPPNPRPSPGAKVSEVAKNAGSPVLPESSVPDGNISSIKKILSVEDADDGMPQGKVGIAVAQSDPAMGTHLSDRPTVADLIVQSFVPGHRPEAAVPLTDIPGHRPAMIAQRAVEAVVQVVETQAAARLQPAPGVQLQLKLGGEDIAIRVELREGSVHTQFRTDSNEVRQAIAQEWTVLQAGSPERTLRYLDPEFSSNHPAFSPGSDGRQGAAPHQQSRSPQPDNFGAVGRSHPYPRSETDQPVREIAARLLPTSVHLSALA